MATKTLMTSPGIEFREYISPYECWGFINIYRFRRRHY